jgi:CCR4-NOT transcription complex subunit 1
VNNSPDFAKERERIFKTFSTHANNLMLLPQFNSSDSVVDSKRNAAGEFSLKDIEDTSMLTGVMAQLGYSCCSNTTIFSKVLTQFPNVNEQDIARVIGLIATTHTGLQPNTTFQASFYSLIGEHVPTAVPSTWNIDVFAVVIRDTFPKLNWKLVVRSFDYPGFKLQDQRSLAIVTQIYRKFTDEALAVEPIIKDQWNNTDGQLSFISLALDAPPDTLNFASPNLRQVSLGQVSNLIRNSSPIWNCLDLIQALLNLAEGENYKKCRKLFDYPSKHYLEQLVIGLAEARPKHIGLQTELLNNFLPIFIRPHKHSFQVLHQIYAVNPLLLSNALAESYCKDPSTLRRILDIAQELKALDAILSTKPYRFVIELATFAAKRDHLNLEHWLSKNIEQNKNSFVQECINFLRDKIVAMKDALSDKSVPLESISVFFKVLQEKSNIIAPEYTEAIMQLYQSIDPAVQNEVTNNEFLASERDEQAANSFFTKIFDSVMSIDQAIDILKELKASKQPKDQTLFACIIHNLFDEYQFFEQYPPEQLTKVARLFGAIIQNNIIVARTLRYALIYVLQALNPQNPRLFQFGLLALNQFKQRIPEWSEFCSHLRQKPQVLQAIPDLVYYLNLANLNQADTAAINTQNAVVSNLQGFTHTPNAQQSMLNIPLNMQNLQNIQSGMQNLSMTSQPTTLNIGQMHNTAQSYPITNTSSRTTTPPPSATSYAPSTPISSGNAANTIRETSPTSNFGFQLDISTLTQKPNEKEIIVPGVDVADKIHFIVNNLSMTNINEKTEELKKYLTPEYYPYFASYFVTNRASLEPNFHKLYSKFLSAINSKALDAEVLQATYSNIKALLNSEKIKSSLSERSLLKNLGSWLGHLTIERNKPILQKDLDLKSLLLDAYENGKLIAVIPFVCKVLNQCQNSKVIKPPNPWVMGLISLLAEFHALPDLKINLKFEVEMLCKNLNLNLSQIETKGLLQNRTPHTDVLANMVPPEKKSSTVAPAATAPQEAPKQVQQAPLLFNESIIPDMQLYFKELPEQVKINPNLQILQLQPGLKKLVYMSIDRAIREIVPPVVKRSVTIASRTTAHIVTKDFCMDTDPTRMVKAAQLMVQNLAAKLAMVTCKDLLQRSINSYLVNALQHIAFEPNDPQLATEITRIAETISTENVDLSCKYVENAATERAAIAINEALMPEFEMRKKSQQIGGQYPWTLYNISNFYHSLPARLAPRNGLMHHHMQVYEDFEIHVGSSEETVQLLPVAHVLERINEIISEIIKSIKKVKKPTSLFSLPMESDVIPQAMSIFSLILQSQSVEDTVGPVLKNIFAKFFDAENQLTREVFFMILERLKASTNNAGRYINDLWFAYTDDKKLTKELAPCFLRAEMLSINEFDNLLCIKLVNDAKNSKVLLKLAVYIVKRLVLTEKSITITSIPKTIDYLVKNVKKLSESYSNLPDLLEQVNMISPSEKCTIENRVVFLIQTSWDCDIQDRESLRERLISKFEQWFKIIYLLKPAPFGDKQNKKKKSMEEQKQAVLGELLKLGVLKTDGEFQSFCQILIQNAFLDFSKNIGIAIKPTILFKYIDTFTDLCANLMFKKVEKNKRASFMKILLQVVAKMLVRDNEIQLEKFNQRFYLRFFSNMLIEMSEALGAISNTEPIAAISNENQQNEEGETSAEYLELLFIFADLFLQLEPSKIPGFSFAWLELISHRMFMPKLFFSKNRKAWEIFHDLLIALFKFLEPYTRNVEMNVPIRLLYKGTLKILLILLHDFPEILCNYHFSLCDVIPPTCIQMRNLILSAFPRNMRLPDPFTPNLKVDLLPETKQAPTILSNYAKALEESKTITKDQVDAFLNSRPLPQGFLNNLKNNLMLPPNPKDPSQPRYNIPLLNSLVLYVGVQAIAHPQIEASIVNTTAMALFEHLIVHLDDEGRYLFLNALANQLRYPNNHTYYFSCVLLYLFSEFPKIEPLSDDLREEIQEQITRVLLERLIVNRPHPWGLLITFIELVKNPRYKFWEKPFIHCAPEIKKLFENVARSL